LRCSVNAALKHALASIRIDLRFAAIGASQIQFAEYYLAFGLPCFTIPGEQRRREPDCGFREAKEAIM